MSVVNSGLIYYALEREYARRQVRIELLCLSAEGFLGLFGFIFHLMAVIGLEDCVCANRASLFGIPFFPFFCPPP